MSNEEKVHHMDKSDLGEDGRGGYREGSGRPIEYRETLVEVKAIMPPSFKKRLREHGDGNLSRGARRLLAAEYDDLTLSKGDLPSDSE